MYIPWVLLKKELLTLLTEDQQLWRTSSSQRNQHTRSWNKKPAKIRRNHIRFLPPTVNT